MFIIMIIAAAWSILSIVTAAVLATLIAGGRKSWAAEQAHEQATQQPPKA